MAEPKAMAKAMYVLATACEVATMRGAFKLEETSEIAEAVKLVKSLVKVEQEEKVDEDEDARKRKEKGKEKMEQEEPPARPKRSSRRKPTP